MTIVALSNFDIFKVRKTLPLLSDLVLIEFKDARIETISLLLFLGIFLKNTAVKVPHRKKSSGDLAAYRFSSSNLALMIIGLTTFELVNGIFYYYCEPITVSTFANCGQYRGSNFFLFVFIFSIKLFSRIEKVNRMNKKTRTTGKQ